MPTAHTPASCNIDCNDAELRVTSCSVDSSYYIHVTLVLAQVSQGATDPHSKH